MNERYPTFYEFMDNAPEMDVEERMLCQAIAALSVCAPYQDMTAEEVYNTVVSRCKLVYAE